jgi:hypothetical protein
MVGGFNTNIRYKGRMFHVQTEDGGLESPQIITLLYEGGAILYSRKSSYADQLDEGELEERVRGLMEEQHKATVKALKGGKLEAKIQKGGDSPAEVEPFGAGVISDTPLVELIRTHLSQ